MQRQHVSSSNLSSVGYDSSTQILEVEFNNRRIYQYRNVPLSIYQGLMRASSHGRYFNKYIVNGRYPYLRVL